MLQNPHRRRCGRYCEADEIGGDYLAWPRRGVAGDERLVTGDMDGAERTQDSPNKNRAGPLRYKTRPAHPFAPHVRYKTRPAHPFAPHVRDKTRPARSKWPKLARFSRAGRTLYRIQGKDGASHNSTPGPTAAEGAGGTGRPGHKARGRRRGLTAMPTVSNDTTATQISHAIQKRK